MGEAGTHPEAQPDGLSLKPRSLRHLVRLPLRVSERRLLLVVLDLLALNGALFLTLALRPRYGPDLRIVVDRPLWFLLLAATWLPLAHAFDAYDLRVASRFALTLPAILKSTLLTTVIYGMIPYLTPPVPASRLALLSFPVLTVVFLLGWRSIYVLALARPFFHRRALIVGTGQAGAAIARALLEHDDGVYRLVGVVDDDPARRHVAHAATGASSQEQPRLARDLPILGCSQDLPELIARHQVTTLILANASKLDGHLVRFLMDCLELGVDIIPMPVLYEQLTGRVPVEYIGDNWYATLPILHPATGALWPAVKRAADVALAGLGLALLGLAAPFIALAIYLDSRGPIFYVQERVGKGGAVFRAYKFRSMIPDAEKGHAVWARKNDTRVTRVGRILRRSHLDELPQFVNILKGDMSMVGPRPERPEFVDELAGEIPFYRVRQAVKPGLVGWGVVKQGYSSSKDDAMLKLEYDLYYIKHQSPWLDIVILLKAIEMTLLLKGR